MFSKVKENSFNIIYSPDLVKIWIDLVKNSDKLVEYILKGD